MHRQHLLTLLDNYAPAGTHQITTRTRISEFVRANRNCFERSLEIGHITGSAFMTDSDRNRIILVSHKKLNLWLQPGGHADGESNIALVAHNEALEETGLTDLRLLSPQIFDLDIHEIPACNSVPAHFHYDIRFLFEANKTIPLRKSSESHEVCWVGLETIAEFTREESIRRMIDKLHADSFRF